MHRQDYNFEPDIIHSVQIKNATKNVALVLKLNLDLVFKTKISNHQDIHIETQNVFKSHSCNILGKYSDQYALWMHICRNKSANLISCINSS